MQYACLTPLCSTFEACVSWDFSAFSFITLIILKHVFCCCFFHDHVDTTFTYHPFFHVSWLHCFDHLLLLLFYRHLLVFSFWDYSYNLYDPPHQDKPCDDIQDDKLDVPTKTELSFDELFTCMRTFLGWYRLSKVEKSSLAFWFMWANTTLEV